MKQNSRKQGIDASNSLASTAAHNVALQRNRAETSVALRKNLLLSAIACVFPNVAWALPESGQVVAGSATISSPNANTTLINQTTDQSIINWQRFNIGSNEYVQFIQPSSSSISLNRVVGGDPSSILGNLSANGHVYLVNPNGIYFGHGVQVDVSGLVASVLDIDNADFMSGNFVFSRDPNSPAGASVINDGIITARDNGYVVLMGDYVANNGVIQAHLGKVVLASGSHITMDVSGGNLVSVAVDEATVTELAGVANSGEIYADGGRVLMTAKVASDLIGSAVNNDGLIQAHSIVEHDGAIFLVAEGGDITHSGTIDASAEAGSRLDGGGVLIRSDKNVTLADGAVIKAEGDTRVNNKGRLRGGAGGVVRVIAEEFMDHQAGASIDVSGADGKGGFVELSGHGGLAIRGQVNLGTGGSLLIDPLVLNIVNGSTMDVSTASTYVVGDIFIKNQLNANNNVTLVASSAVNAPGFVNIFATGTGDLAIKIGTLVPGGSLGSISGATPNYNCATAGFCLGGATYAFSPSTTGSLNLGNLSVSIAGGLTLAGGTGIAGDVSIGSISAGGNVLVTAGRDITFNGNVNDAGTSLVANAGNDIFVNGAFGSTKGTNQLDAKVTLRANNNVNINNNIVLATRNLVLAANNDGVGGGDVNINGQAGQKRTVSTRRAMTISGHDFNVFGASTSGFAGSPSQVLIKADDVNQSTTTDTITINLSGDMLVQGGNGVARVTSGCSACAISNVSTIVRAGSDITINATNLNVNGGSATATNGSFSGGSVLSANANAEIDAGRDLRITLSNDLNVSAGTANAQTSGVVETAKATANATLKAGRNVVISADGNLNVNAGSAYAAGTTTNADVDAKADARIIAANNMTITAGSLMVSSGFANASPSAGPVITGKVSADASAWLEAGGLMTIAVDDLLMNSYTTSGRAQARPTTFIQNALSVINAGGLHVTVSGDVNANSATISAGGMYMNAGGNINMATSTLNIGNGTVAGVLGDALILQALQASGVTLPSSSNPNLRMIAGGNLDVGSIDLLASSAYLWLSASNTSISSMTAPNGANVLLQYSPSNPNSSIGFENLPYNGQTVNYNNQNHVFPFPVTTLVLGSSAQTGDITIGANGVINLGSSNILAATVGGTVDSLDNVITTGIVASLQGAVFVTPTLEDILIDIDDPSFLDDDENRKKLISLADDDGEIQMCVGQ